MLYFGKIILTQKLIAEYGKAAEGVYEARISWLPWLPAAVLITFAALAVSCIGLGLSERK